MYRILFFLLGVFFVFETSKVYAITELKTPLEQNTTLSREQSPYLISGVFKIQEGVTLIIEKGVTIQFAENASISNYGRLVVEGTNPNPVLFKSQNLGQSWNYIFNYGTVIAKRLHVKHAKRMVTCHGDSLVLTNCSFSASNGIIGDDAIASHDTPYIRLIANNLVGSASGKIDAIDLDGVDDVVIDGNTIRNFADDGIDIGTFSTNVIIKNNTISNCDMGISVGESSTAFLFQNLIVNCSAGIQSHTKAVTTADKCTLYGNFIGVRALHNDSQLTSFGTVYISNSIIVKCIRSTDRRVDDSVIEYAYCLSDSTVLVGTGNVLADPLFADVSNGDYHLSNGSVAIDNGDLVKTDSDGSRLDMGRYTFFQSPLQINEINPANLNGIRDSAREFDDWIELLNASSEPINLKGYYISDSRNDLLKYRIKDDIVVAADSTIHFWADDSVKQGKFHLPFKLSAMGEFLAVLDSSAQILDSVRYPQIPINYSYARDEKSRNWKYYETPTPYASNKGLGIANRSGNISFEHNGGEGLMVSERIQTIDAYDTAFFTDNLVDPIVGEKFSEAIPVNETKVIRAVAKSENRLPGVPSSRFYYSKGFTTLPVISLAMNDEDLYGPTGIHTNYNKSTVNWERPVDYSYYNNGFKWAQQAGIRIQGGNSVGMTKKAFRLFFRGGYGKDESKSPFNGGPSKLTRMVVRSGYDDDVTRSTGTLLRDPFASTLWKAMGEPASETDFVTLFLNNNYRGIYNIRESIDEDFFAPRLHTEKFDLVRFLKSGEEIKYGSGKSWSELMHLINAQNFESDDAYQRATRLLDIDALLNLLSFVHCTGFRSWTWGTFGAKPNDGKWTWTIWDTDRAFSDYNWNGFTEYAFTYSEKWSNIIPQKLIKNPQFKEELINRNCDLLNTHFNPEHSISILDSLKTIIEPEIGKEFDRWATGRDASWEVQVESIRDFLRKRPDALYLQMRRYFNLNDTSHIDVRIEGEGKVQLNSITITKKGFKGVYMEGNAIHLRAIPSLGYEFVEWKNIGSNSAIRIMPENHSKVVAVFKKALTTSYQPLVINEIMYHPKKNSGGEWVEIYNPNAYTINCANFSLTDNGANNGFVFPKGTTITGKGYLIVCGDTIEFDRSFSDVNNRIGSFNKTASGFQLNNSNETVILFDTKHELEDAVPYSDVPLWLSLADGGGASLQLISTAVGNEHAFNWNTDPLKHFTPGEANSIETALPSVIKKQELSVYPNPVRGAEMDFVFSSDNNGMLKVTLFAISGKKLLHYNLNHVGGEQNYSISLGANRKGVYILNVEFNAQVYRSTVVVIQE